ncbi:hypothetical protein KJZ24_16145 [Enterococcus faecalis]|uniref:Uncharacterized protein n=7 Tax=Phifelvirus TaxID=1623299 RepID=D2IYT2_9CAUD|nr:hypothetical protein [Enterococcus faecalis]YP_003347301.1 hypothetical protein EP-phiFL2A_gp10 [Enterococcus phage phiFL2A]YP_003347467.1 hypothetical protein EP-phiFL1Ap10 [Enterococcus phage phiFL1A]YP_003347572.1 hypothetical protein EP-phiFL3A_gp10 [Enterococcus phage phiFL3A]ACZ63770.1 conserved hypothetical protein [Enterococcus phage phiFL1B]ACZ63833.1 conserved hypothetical protein [Enterococcus phage phiFL1C]ACZ63970.1 conserved hypothetical protein [Enterococcus phage phiFL2B]A
MKENEFNEERKQKIYELALEIVELLKEHGNPNMKIEISIDRIEQTSVDWSEPTPAWD